MSIKKLFLVLLSLSLLPGCAAYTRYSRGDSCEKSIKSYRQMVRWMELEKAAISLVDNGQRDSFGKDAEQLRRRGITVVDTRVLAQQCQAERGAAEATLEYDYFALPDNRIKTVTDRQKWIYREEDKMKPEIEEGWRLTSPLPAFR